MSVIAGTGAATAGLKQGDVIVGLNGTTHYQAQDITSVLAGLHPGDTITLKIGAARRNSRRVILGTQPQELGRSQYLPSTGRMTPVM